MKFLLDACVPLSSKEIVQKYGDAIHAREVGLGKASDREIIKYSLENKLI